MSLSSPVVDKAQNPTSKYLKFNSKEGKFAYFDKEQKEKVAIPLPYTFLILDSRVKITGWDDDDGESGSAIWSNEVPTLNTPLRINNGSRLLLEGLYSDIKPDIIANKGMLFSNVLYVAEVDASTSSLTGDIHQITLTKSVLGAWMEFKKDAKIKKLEGSVITAEGVINKKKGSNKYCVPKFAELNNPLSQDQMDIAVELDRSLQSYFDSLENKQEETLKEDTSFDFGDGLVPHDNVAFATLSMEHNKDEPQF